VVTDYIRPYARRINKVFGGWERDLIEKNLKRIGLHPSDVHYMTMDQPVPKGAEVILALGEKTLQLLTGRKGLEKWHLSPLYSVIDQRPVMPIFHPDRVSKEFSKHFHFSLAFEKCKGKLTGEDDHWPVRDYEFLLNPTLSVTKDYLMDVVRPAEVVSVDIETGKGQINTLGFSTSPTKAIAIQVLPDRCSALEYYRIWDMARGILEDPRKKLILQNFMYETQYFSLYGIRMITPWHDAMLAQKILYPEFKMGLDEIARFYTKRPYWKDDGKSWNNIRDWPAHYRYNCMDTSGTFEACEAQRRDLEDRGLTGFFDEYIMRLAPAVREMCLRGLPISEGKLGALKEEVGTRLQLIQEDLKKATGKEDLNPRSSAQLKSYFREQGYDLYKSYNKLTKQWKDSTDQKSLKKLRRRYPGDESIDLLIQFSTWNKANTSYLSFTYDRDSRVRYSIKTTGTETLRFSGSKDPWGNGFNPQTIPGGTKGFNLKPIFEASPGRMFVQCDLKQAESRFVAYDAPDPALISMLEDPTKDIHEYVAAEIFGKSVSEITKQERQLGKKSGHGANYSMKEGTFMDVCLQEMDLVLSRKEATNVLESYHRLFPGIRRWHQGIRTTLCRQGYLDVPFGWRRYFYGRMDDDTFREAYAFRPQSTIPYITNCIMRGLLTERDRGNLDFWLLLQVHDSLILEVPVGYVDRVAQYCLALDKWHPKIELQAGTLRIPTAVEYGSSLGDLKEYTL